MKTKLARIVSLINKIDPRHVQAAYFFLMLGLSVVMRAPSDGGIGPV